MTRSDRKNMEPWYRKAFWFLLIGGMVSFAYRSAFGNNGCYIIDPAGWCGPNPYVCGCTTLDEGWECSDFLTIWVNEPSAAQFTWALVPGTGSTTFPTPGAGLNPCYFATPCLDVGLCDDGIQENCQPGAQSDEQAFAGPTYVQGQPLNCPAAGGGGGGGGG